jgi:hypothetical protein
VKITQTTPKEYWKTSPISNPTFMNTMKTWRQDKNIYLNNSNKK